LRFIPSFAFGYGIINIGNRALYATLANTKVLSGPFDMNIAGGDVMYLAFSGPLYFILLFLFEYLFG